MQRLRVWGLALLIPALLVFASGCGKADDKKGSGSTQTSSDVKDKDKDKDTTSSGVKKEMTALASKGKATLKGQITYDGDAPKVVPLNFGEKPPDEHCKKGDTDVLTWEVDPNPNSKGVKNVVIWVKPGPNKYFSPESIPEALKKRTDKAIMDQPHCNFIPHVVAFNPSIWDGKKQQPTGQEFVMKNAAPLLHNSKWEGDARVPNYSDNKPIPAKGQITMDLKAAADNRTGDHLVNIACNIHPWMNAKVWALDTPFFAVTDKEGKFEIKDVPADAEVYIVAWHEETGNDDFLLPEAKPVRAGEMVKLKDGEVKEMNFKIKKK